MWTLARSAAYSAAITPADVNCFSEAPTWNLHFYGDSILATPCGNGVKQQHKQRAVTRIAAYLIAVTVLVGSHSTAQLRVTSLTPGGELTWTNSVSNARYRVEWAASPGGTWQPFEAFTNLNSIRVTNASVTVQLPPVQEARYYRVIWSDAPLFAGLYEVRECSSTNDELVVSGTIWLSGDPGSGYVYGTSDLHLVGTTNDPPFWSQFGSYPGPQLGLRLVGGGFSGSSFPHMYLIVSPEWADDNVNLDGFLVGNTYMANWDWNTGGLSLLTGGRLTGLRLNASPAPAANPFGVWQYVCRTASNGTSDAMNAAGQLTLLTATNSITGTWTFSNQYPSLVTMHMLGIGDCTGNMVSNNTVAIDMRSTNGVFRLAGTMSGDLYAGFSQWVRTNETQPQPFGLFLATRIAGH